MKETNQCVACLQWQRPDILPAAISAAVKSLLKCTRLSGVFRHHVFREKWCLTFRASLMHPFNMLLVWSVWATHTQTGRQYWEFHKWEQMGSLYFFLSLILLIHLYLYLYIIPGWFKIQRCLKISGISL